MTNNCNKCNCSTDLFFCPSCGKILSYPVFIKGNTDLEQKLSLFTKQLVNKAKASKFDIIQKPETNKIANETVKNYFHYIAFLHSLCKDSSSDKYYKSKGSVLYEEMIRFGKSCAFSECEIAIVGTIKARKSCLINAILDKELTSVNAVPETASLTKFRYSPTDYVKISFYNTEEWKKLMKSVEEADKGGLLSEENNFLSVYRERRAEKFEEQLVNKENVIVYPKSLEELKDIIAKYSSAKSAEHFFVKELEVGLSDFNVPKNIVFVDTPGLGDPITYRSDITNKYLKSAKVVLLCSKAASAELRADELYLIGKVFEPMVDDRKSRVYIVGTQFDMQSSPYSYWENKTKPEWLKYLSEKKCFNNRELANKHLVPAAPYIYSLINRYIADPTVWNTEKNLITNSVNNFLGIVDKDELIEKYGEEEGKKIYFDSDTRARLSRQSEELLKKTNIPFFKKMIFDGPVKNAETIILQDLRKDYGEIKNSIQEISGKVYETHMETIINSNAQNIEEQINELTKNNIKKKAVFNRNKEALYEILQELEKETKAAIKKIKSEVKQ